MFTFSNPLLLWAFPILVLPWIFRRRQEERIRRVDFPLLRFLLESEDKELVNPQLQELLLLILRTLILAMLLLSLAGPRWVTDTGLNNRFLSFLPFGQTFTTNVIALDTSYSMGYGEGTDSWWNRAERTVNQPQGELTGFSTQWVNWDVTITQTETPGVFYQCPRHNWRQSGRNYLERRAVPYWSCSRRWEGCCREMRNL